MMKLLHFTKVEDWIERKLRAIAIFPYECECVCSQKFYKYHSISVLLAITIGNITTKFTWAKNDSEDSKTCSCKLLNAPQQLFLRLFLLLPLLTPDYNSHQILICMLKQILHWMYAVRWNWILWCVTLHMNSLNLKQSEKVFNFHFWILCLIVSVCLV